MQDITMARPDHLPTDIDAIAECIYHDATELAGLFFLSLAQFDLMKPTSDCKWAESNQQVALTIIAAYFMYSHRKAYAYALWNITGWFWTSTTNKPNTLYSIIPKISFYEQTSPCPASPTGDMSHDAYMIAYFLLLAFNIYKLCCYFLSPLPTVEAITTYLLKPADNHQHHLLYLGCTINLHAMRWGHTTDHENYVTNRCIMFFLLYYFFIKIENHFSDAEHMTQHAPWLSMALFPMITISASTLPTQSFFPPDNLPPGLAFLALTINALLAFTAFTYGTLTVRHAIELIKMVIYQPHPSLRPNPSRQRHNNVFKEQNPEPSTQGAHTRNNHSATSF